MAAAQLPRNPLHTPPARPQAHHLRHVIRRLHHLPPWIIPRRAFSDSFPLHSLSPQLSEEGAIPRDAEGAVFHGARQQIYFTDVRTGTIGARAGVPIHADQWGWSIGFYRGMEPGTWRSGIAATFEAAREAFEAAWS